MFLLRKDTKYFLVFMIFIISILFGYRRSNIIRLFLPRPVTLDSRAADKVFDNSNNQRKISLRYSVENDSQIREKINNLAFAENVYTKYSDSKKSYMIYIFEIPHQNAENIIKELRQLPGITAENIKSDADFAVDANIKENLDNYKLTKNRLQELINKTTSPQSLAKFQSDLERTQAKIDSLNNYVSIQDRYANNDLLYIISTSSASSFSATQIIGRFFSTTFLVMLFLIGCLLIFYLLMIVLTRVMSTLGIHTSHGSGSGSPYSYKSAYGKSYGRKVKRIYKDKSETQKEDSEKE
jgi:hypothetical protein